MQLLAIVTINAATKLQALLAKKPWLATAQNANLVIVEKTVAKKMAKPAATALKSKNRNIYS